MKIIVLDAMGVIYSIKDDVRDLLYPFILAKRGLDDFSQVEALYRSASLGNISADDFWKRVKVDPAAEDEYLNGHALTDGVNGFLETAKSRCQEVWCLSNDVSRWSKKLRLRFGLQSYIARFIISGDVGMRKPDPAIYALLIERLQRVPGDVVFIDDNIRNLESAATFGVQTLLFNPGDQDLSRGKHSTAKNFEELGSLLFQ